MIRLITPPGMLLTVALMVVYGAYAFLTAFIEKSWALSAAGFLTLIACFGTALLKPWSQYLVYLLTAGFIGKLALSIYAGVVSGFFTFQFGSVTESLQSLGPSALMALLSCACCYLVFRHFQRTSAPKGGGATAAEDDHPASGGTLLDRRLADE